MNEARIRQIVGGCETAPICLEVAAYRLADAVHEGQYRKSGQPYITHPVAVHRSIEGIPPYDTTDEAVALLHDTLEDLDRLNGQRTYAESLIADAIEHCCGSQVLAMVKLMAKDGLSEREYLGEIAGSEYPSLTLIKLKDRLVNLHDCALPREEDRLWFVGYAQRALEEVYDLLVAPFLLADPPEEHRDLAIHYCNTIERRAHSIVQGKSELHDPTLAFTS